LNREINLIVVSALLMIAGYSLTDTVVVFDRIRENIRLKPRESAYTIINLSINEVLSRTIITSLTTFFAAFALFILGGEIIHDFAFAIMLGIIIGTYSSIFVASPIVLAMGGKKAFIKIKKLYKNFNPCLPEAGSNLEASLREESLRPEPLKSFKKL
jgi:preprotein translocase subunit SecF